MVAVTCLVWMRKMPRLVAVVRSVCSDLGGGAVAKDIALSLEAPPSIVLAAQPELLAVLVRNLLDNAIRYTPAGGRVDIAVSDASEAAILHIVDNGPGVSPDKLALLGRRFGRFQEEGPEGVGLGLSIVGRIAALNGGAVAFAPGARGKGLSVTVRFPRGSE